MMRLRALMLILVTAVAVSGLIAQEKKAGQQSQADAGANNQEPVLQPVKAARQFLAGLSDSQKSQAVLAFDDQQRVQWHFIPKPTRKGLPLMEMNGEQKEAANALLRSVLSRLGYQTGTRIMQLESLLRRLEGPGSEQRRNPEKYYFTLFGTPGPKAKWGLSVEGHHLSLNFVLEGNQITASTPQFFGANPAELKEDYGEGFEKGLQVLRAEEQLGFRLIRSLDASQRARAMLPGETPREIRAAGEAQPPLERLPGIAASQLNPDQQALLRKLLQAYTAKMKRPVAEARWKAIEEAGFDQIVFSWSGATKPGAGHYYVIQGPTFVVELINVQPDAAGNPANHVHCVWRDMRGDFGLPIQQNP